MANVVQVEHLTYAQAAAFLTEMAEEALLLPRYLRPRDRLVLHAIAQLLIEAQIQEVP